jgi:hypothetical protein
MVAHWRRNQKDIGNDNKFCTVEYFLHMLEDMHVRLIPYQVAGMDAVIYCIYLHFSR